MSVRSQRFSSPLLVLAAFALALSFPAPALCGQQERAPLAEPTGSAGPGNPPGGSGLGGSPAPGPSGAQSECRALFDLYRICYETGLNADSDLTCMTATNDLMVRSAQRLLSAGQMGKRRFSKGQGAAQALVEVVCSTGCQDATTTQIRATRQEFTEAFCD